MGCWQLAWYIPVNALLQSNCRLYNCYEYEKLTITQYTQVYMDYDL